MNAKRIKQLDRRIRRALLSVAAMTGLLLSACTHSDQDLRDYIAQVKARPAPPLDPLPVIQQFETFEYAAQNQRDPFSPPLLEREEAVAGAGLRPDQDRRKELLEAFPLDSLDMVGTLGTGSAMVALIVDPEGVVYQVRSGNYMGQSDGKVTAVREDGIDLVELVPDGAGGWIERDATVALDDQ